MYRVDGVLLEEMSDEAEHPLTPAYSMDSRLTRGSAPRPLAASQQ